MLRSPVSPPPAGVAPPTTDASQPGTGGPLAVRAQLLATEHWSLLATRSMTQSEILSRITMFLMLVSASIVSLALIGQFTRFDDRFITFARHLRCLGDPGFLRMRRRFVTLFPTPDAAAAGAGSGS